MEIKEEIKGSICNQCKYKEIIWNMKHKKPMCANCLSFDIKSIIKKWVAVDDVIKVVERLKAKFDSRKVDHTTSRKREIKSLKRLIVLAFQELNSQSNENKKEEK